jgi:hypothetical protein
MDREGTLVITGIFPEEISIPDWLRDHLDMATPPPEMGEKPRIFVASRNTP